jgi:hypothetical protein
VRGLPSIYYTSRQADDHARDVASTAAGDAQDRCPSTAMCRLAHAPWHGLWGDGRQPPAAERPTARAESQSASSSTSCGARMTEIYSWHEPAQTRHTVHQGNRAQSPVQGRSSSRIQLQFQIEVRRASRSLISSRIRSLHDLISCTIRPPSAISSCPALPAISPRFAPSACASAPASQRTSWARRAGLQPLSAAPACARRPQTLAAGCTSTRRSARYGSTCARSSG